MKHPIIKTIGIALFSFFISLTITAGGNGREFLDIPLLLYFILIPASLGLASYRTGGPNAFLRASKKHFIITGILTTLVRIILYLQYVLDPNSLGQMYATLLLPTFYTIIFYCLADAITDCPRAVDNKT